MQGYSPELADTIQHSHTAVIAADLIQGGSVTRKLEAHAGSVTADRTAAQMRTFEFEIIDRDGTLTPVDMTSPLAPFGSRIQLYRGARIRNEAVQSVMYPSMNSWTPNTLTGQMVSVKIDPNDGSLTMGQ